MSVEFARNWISLFISGGYLLSLFGAAIGFFAAISLKVKIVTYLNPATRQDVKPSTLAAYFMVAVTGMSLLTFTESATDAVYHGMGNVSSGAGNPLSWRLESAPNLTGSPAELVLMAVVLVGFSFLGGVAFFKCMLTMFRFDKLHPQNNGAFKDFLMYMFGGIACTTLPTTMSAIAIGLPFLRGTSEMLNKASQILSM